jgi:hypothetical protein
MPSILVNYDAIDDVGLTSVVVIDMHACSRADPLGFDFSAGLVHVLNRLAEDIRDRVGRRRRAHDDRFARLQRRHRPVG